MSNSARALAAVNDTPRDPMDRQRLREEWRMKALEHSAARDYADRLKEGKSILLDEMVLRLTAPGADGKAMSAVQAERVARTSEQFRAYVRKMHDAARKAQDLSIAAEDANRAYWELVGVEADARVERRNSNG